MTRPEPTTTLPLAAADAATIKRRWRAGGDPDAVAALHENPDLLRFQSLVIDLAYEEYCLREDAGAAPDPDSFAARFPAFRSAIRDVIRGHVWFDDQPELTADGPATWPQPGDVVEGCRVVGEIARGAFARVYLAEDPEVGRHVVLKVAPARSAEARALGKVRHPHVIDVYWAKPVGGLFVLCMPFVGVATLQDVCESVSRGPIPPADGRAILDAVAHAGAAFADLLPPPSDALLTGGERYEDAVAAVTLRAAEALAALHRAGVVHADFKPSNVLVAPGASPYLIDFNLAVRPGVGDIRCGGTLPYMPPELLRGLATDGPAPSEATPRADVYAFGVILHQLLTGRLPFTPVSSAGVGAVAANLLEKQRAGIAPLPGRLFPLIARCLAFEPQDRPASADDIARELRKLHSPPRHQTRRWHRVAAVAAVPAALLATGFGTWEWAGRKTVEPAPILAEPTTPAEHFQVGRRFLSEGRVNLALNHFQQASAVQYDGRTLAHISYCLAAVKQSGPALATATEAINAGYDTPAVRNNRAYASLLSGTLPHHIADAVEDLKVALIRNPNLRAAHYNMALALYSPHKGKGTSPDPVCVWHLEQVLTGEPKTDQLYFEAAEIFAAASRRQPELRRKALDCVRESIRRGKKPQQLNSDPGLRAHLAGDTEFEALRAATAGPAEPRLPFDPRLVDPGSGQ
jgi:serine/threonine protein kinase